VGRGIQFVARDLEPWGFLIAVVALGNTMVEIKEARKERKRDRALREATLYAMASERLAAARAADKAGETGWPPEARLGQRRALEAMVEIGASTGGIDASETTLADANLRGAILIGADLNDAFLAGTNFHEAILGGANFRETDLSYASLHDANLHNANLSGTDLSGANLRGARNLTQSQLGEACGNQPTELPAGLTIKPCDKSE
jgi:uncharacterized protein YjbI with pentapeptide repeats